MQNPIPFIRPLDTGMGEAVARRTVFHPTRTETWGDVATRVAVGNSTLVSATDRDEVERLRNHIAAGRVLMSGRHLQHGDSDQVERPMEVFTNCATASTSHGLFLLLLSGSGVGRCYDDALMLVDWSAMPRIYPVLRSDHDDSAAAWYMEAGRPTPFMTPETAYYAVPTAEWFTVPDTREGWAKALELLEVRTFERSGRPIVMDFSQVRPKGAPIGGMQNRPASGPVPCMQAFMQAAAVSQLKVEPWELTMRIDHAFAACVAVGGARRAARMSWKWWGDRGIQRFIDIKQHGGLWSSNNSVGVDAEFWAEAKCPGTRGAEIFDACVSASYTHGTGEPGFLNLDRLHQNREGLDSYLDGRYAGSSRYRPEERTIGLMSALARAANDMRYPYGTNPCGEVPLHALGGFCVIADVVPYYCDTEVDMHDAVRLAARALVRVNRMESYYQREVERTNRIGVGLTGIQELAWHHFGFTFRDLINESLSQPFWQLLERLRTTVEQEATAYAIELGMAVPHTFCTVKPAGTTSKLFGLTEGGHLAAMRRYLRWVQFKQEDPLVEEYERRGYPVMRTIPQGTEGEGYNGMSLVGFPTEPLITSLGIPEDRFVTATEATPEEQYEWVRLLEKYWLGPNGHQVSYTLKFDRAQVSLEEFRRIVLTNQPTVRCVSVMPSDDWRTTAAKYGYNPEQPLTDTEYFEIVARIDATTQTVNLDDLQCASGACPI